MKTGMLALLSTVLAAPAMAGGLAPSVAAVQEVVPDNPSSLAGWLLPLLIILIIAAMRQPDVCVRPTDFTPDPCYD